MLLAGFQVIMSKNTKVCDNVIDLKDFTHKIKKKNLVFLFVGSASLPLAETVRTPEEIKACRAVVVNDLLESERAHVAEIRGLLENFLEPLSSGQM